MESVEFTPVRGRIHWGHVARSRAVRKIVERGIARWTSLHRTPGADGALASAGAQIADGRVEHGADLTQQTGGGDEIPSGVVPRYEAVIERHGEGHLVHCEIRVVDGDRLWFGSRVGQGIQQALADCLAHMTLIGQSLNLPAPQPQRA